MNDIISNIVNDLLEGLLKYGAGAVEYNFMFEKDAKNYKLEIKLKEDEDEEESNGEDAE